MLCRRNIGCKWFDDYKGLSAREQTCTAAFAQPQRQSSAAAAAAAVGVFFATDGVCSKKIFFLWCTMTTRAAVPATVLMISSLDLGERHLSK